MKLKMSKLIWSKVPDDGMPYKHSILGTVYEPIDIMGTFKEAN